MKKSLIVFVIVSLAGQLSHASGSQYRADSKHLDSWFEAAEESSFEDFIMAGNWGHDVELKDKNPWVAFTLCAVFFVTGFAGIHRAYLGSGGLIFVAYFCTGGGCSILQIVDAVILFIAALEDKGASRYAYNRQLFMW